MYICMYITMLATLVHSFPRWIRHRQHNKKTSAESCVLHPATNEYQTYLQNIFYKHARSYNNYNNQPLHELAYAFFLHCCVRWSQFISTLICVHARKLLCTKSSRFGLRDSVHAIDRWTASFLHQYGIFWPYTHDHRRHANMQTDVSPADQISNVIIVI